MAKTVKELKQLSMVDVARSLGMELERFSSYGYQWKEHPSLKINTRENYFNWFSRSKGGDVFKLVQCIREEQTGTMPSFKEAKHFLETGDFSLAEEVKPQPKEPFSYYLAQYETDFKEARDYLKQERGLSHETIDFFLDKGVMAQATKKTGNVLEPVIVFKSFDRSHKLVGGSLQGFRENDDLHERGRLKQIMRASDGSTGLNVDIGEPKRLIFAEAPIDLMSYYELHKDSLEDVRLVAMDGLKEGSVSRHVADLFYERGIILSLVESAKQGSFLANTAKTTNVLEQYQDLITLAVDHDEAGLRFIKRLEDKGIPFQTALPPLKEGETKSDWNDILKASKYPQDKDNSRLTQAKRKLERLEHEFEEATQAVYRHTAQANGQPMNDKREGARFARQSAKLEGQALGKLEAIRKQEERIKHLERQERWQEEGLNRRGMGLDISVQNLPRLKEEVARADRGQANYGKETINRYRKEIERLESIKELSETVLISSKAQSLIDDNLVSQWKKQPSLYFVRGLRRTALELTKEGIFIESDRYPAKTPEDKEKVAELLSGQEPVVQPILAKEEKSTSLEAEVEYLSTVYWKDLPPTIQSSEKVQELLGQIEGLGQEAYFWVTEDDIEQSAEIVSKLDDWFSSGRVDDAYESSFFELTVGDNTYMIDFKGGEQSLQDMEEYAYHVSERIHQEGLEPVIAELESVITDFNQTKETITRAMDQQITQWLSEETLSVPAPTYRYHVMFRGSDNDTLSSRFVAGENYDYESFVSVLYPENERLIGLDADSQEVRFDLFIVSNETGEVEQVADISYKLGKETQVLSDKLQGLTDKDLSALSQIDGEFSERTKKALDQNQGQEKKEGTSQYKGSLQPEAEGSATPEAIDITSFERSVTSRPTISPHQLNFSIEGGFKSRKNRVTHSINSVDLAKLNRWGNTLQAAARFYKDELENATISYFTSDGSLAQVNFLDKNFMHLTGIKVVGEGQTPEKFLNDLVNGGTVSYEDIRLPNNESAFDKIKVLPDLGVVLQTNAFYFTNLDSIPRYRGRFDSLIKSEDRDIMVLFRTTEENGIVPTSVFKVREKLREELAIADKNEILGIYRERDGKIEQLAINDDYIKDGGREMMAILENKEYKEIVMYKQMTNLELEQGIEALSKHIEEVRVNNDDFMMTNSLYLLMVLKELDIPFVDIGTKVLSEVDAEVLGDTNPEVLNGYRSAFEKISSFSPDIEELPKQAEFRQLMEDTGFINYQVPTLSDEANMERLAFAIANVNANIKDLDYIVRATRDVALEMSSWHFEGRFTEDEMLLPLRYALLEDIAGQAERYGGSFIMLDESQIDEVVLRTVQGFETSKEVELEPAKDSTALEEFLEAHLPQSAMDDKPQEPWTMLEWFHWDELTEPISVSWTYDDLVSYAFETGRNLDFLNDAYPQLNWTQLAQSGVRFSEMMELAEYRGIDTSILSQAIYDELLETDFFVDVVWSKAEVIYQEKLKELEHEKPRNFFQRIQDRVQNFFEDEEARTTQTLKEELAVDTDGDGIPDEVERRQGTNPYSSDMDGDGKSDAEEIGFGSNPLEAEPKEETKETTQTVSELIANKDTAGLTKHLKEGVKDYFDSETYKNYLTAVSKLHDYSPRNIRLMLAQNPNITTVASYNSWKTNFDRQVLKGQKGIKIFAPQIHKIKDPETGEVLKDDEGNDKTQISFKMVTVFDISQTEGKDLPSPVNELNGSYEDYAKLYHATRSVAEANKVKVAFQDSAEMSEGVNGYYNPEEHKIVLKKGRSEQDTLRTFFHELAHSELHSNDKTEDQAISRSTAELQAESVAFVVASHYGIDTSSYSFGYLASWTQDEAGLADLEAQMTIVQEKASDLIKRIDHTLETYKTKEVTKSPVQAKIEEVKSRASQSKEKEEAQSATKKAQASKNEMSL